MMRPARERVKQYCRSPVLPVYRDLPPLRSRVGNSRRTAAASQSEQANGLISDDPLPHWGNGRMDTIGIEIGTIGPPGNILGVLQVPSVPNVPEVPPMPVPLGVYPALLLVLLAVLILFCIGKAPTNWAGACVKDL
jgi:hypothetical protein